MGGSEIDSFTASGGVVLVSGPFLIPFLTAMVSFFKKRVRFPDPVSGLPLSGAYKGRGAIFGPHF